MNGYCYCGCGKKTSIPTYSCANRGIIKGQPRKYIHGHNRQWGKLANHPDWQGGRFYDSSGYVTLKIPTHSNADKKGCVKEHIFIASQALGKPLSQNVEVHHFNCVRDDNQNCNLIICENRGYHHLLHDRTNALRECGHANWRKCYICHKYDDPKNLYLRPTEGGVYHRKCYNERNYERIKNNRLERRTEDERFGNRNQKDIIT